MITYLDTSTIIKLLIAEPGTFAAGVIWDEPDVLATARIAYVEARAALAAARRQQRISAAVLTAPSKGWSCSGRSSRSLSSTSS